MKTINRKGFTLVELVVVIAIIGVLAAILVPSMMNYVKKSRLTTANGNAKTAYNAAMTYITDMNIEGYDTYDLLYGPEPGRKFNLGFKNATLNVLNDGDQAIADALQDNGNAAGWFCTLYPEINGERRLVVQWRKTNGDNIFGQYPDQITWNNWNEHHDDSEFEFGRRIAPL